MPPPTQMPVAQARPAVAFTLERPQHQRPNWQHYQAKNSQYGETVDLSFNLSSKQFIPSSQ